MDPATVSLLSNYRHELSVLLEVAVIYLLLTKTSIYGHSPCGDKANGNQSMQSDSSGISEYGQFGVRMLPFIISAAPVKSKYYT